MRRRKFLLGSAAGIASASFLTGTKAFSSAEVERDVKIEVVSDSEGYLGLTENGEEKTEYLFGDEETEAPAIFKITNQTPETVEVDLSLKENKIVFSEPAKSEFLISLSSGESIDHVEVSLPHGTERQDTLVFDITEKEGEALSIYAERMLKLKPKSVDASIAGAGSIKSNFVVNDPDDAVIEKFVIDGEDFDPITSGSNSSKIDYDEKSELGCNSNGEVTVTVTGYAPGKVFTENLNGVNCLGNGGNSENNGDNKGGGHNGDDEDADNSREDTENDDS